MSLRIYIAHTGEGLTADPVSFASPDALRTWIHRNTSILPQRQILMTARGKNVKVQTLAAENEIFVYDRQYVGEPGTTEPPEDPMPEPFVLESPPDTLADQNDLHAWRNLYMARRTWALNLASRCAPVHAAADQQNERTEIVHRAVGVALENLKSHVGSLEQKFQEAQAWANDLLKEQKIALDGWQRALAKLDNIPARKGFGFLRRPSTPKKGSDTAPSTLQSFVDVEEVRRAGSQGAAVSQQFVHRMEEVEQAVHNVVSDTRALLDDAQPPPLDNVGGLLEEVETIAKKISSDYEHVLGLPNNAKALSSISRMALGHTKDLLPSLTEISQEMHAGLRQAIHQHNATVKSAIAHMQTISAIESRLANVQNQINTLDVDGDAFDILYTVFQLPVVYGSVLVECVRRREWSEKMKADSLALAEEMAVFRDEEQRRRKKWVKSLDDFLSLPDDTTPGIEINLQGQGAEWPEVTRKEIEQYIFELKNKNGMSAVVQELTQLFKDLDAPTRQQRRRAKAFKQGSVFDMSRSSLLLRGDDMVRSLKDEKTKLEERLKGSESRIRKLEDLLHRQSQISRPSSGNFNMDIPTSPASPRPDALSRRSSVSSRRMSSNHSPEDRALVQRIVSLEAELAAEKDTVAKLQKEAHMERQSSTDRIQEAQSTKKDLIENLEARQKEFEDERRFLESESNKLKIKLEEVEEELDRMIDAREHERSEADEHIQQLQADLERARNDAADQVQKINGQLDFIRSDYNLQKERANDLGEQVKAYQVESGKLDETKKELMSQIQNLQGREKEHLNSLFATHMNLAPEGAPPDDFTRLVKAIEILSEGLAIHARGSDEKAANAMSENKAFEERVADLEGQIEHLQKQLETLGDEKSTLQHALAEEESKETTVRSELEDERAELKHLRSKFAAGETGSEALRERVAEEERKVANLSERLASLDSNAKNYEEEILGWKKKVEGLTEAQAQSRNHLEARRSRSKELSKLLYMHIELLGQVLEQLGFSIVWQDERMVIQRASKLNSSSGIGDHIVSSTLIPMSQDPELLHWTQSEDPDQEAARFRTFIDSLNKFDVNTFGEAVAKRVKDIEVLARKWQKEARGYRDKYHRAQIEAHDKIAYRSFKEGDLALFLPTRNQAIRSWAAFNVGAPHYFLREQDGHKLQTRDWLLARISRVEERVVDLSKSMNGGNPDRRSIGETSDGASIDDDNPFELSDGLRWYLLDASEEKPGAPSTPGLGKSTVASAHVDAKGSIRLKRTDTAAGGATRTLSKSLDSRRSSSNSKKGAPVPPLRTNESAGDNVQPAPADTSAEQLRDDAPVFEEGMDTSRRLHRDRDQIEQLPDSPSRVASPLGPESRDSISPSPSSSVRASHRGRPWEKLLSLDYRLESSSPRKK